LPFGPPAPPVTDILSLAHAGGDAKYVCRTFGEYVRKGRFDKNFFDRRREVDEAVAYKVQFLQYG
jgi:hypothetical protein